MPLVISEPTLPSIMHLAPFVSMTALTVQNRQRHVNSFPFSFPSTLPDSRRRRSELRWLPLSFIVADVEFPPPDAETATATVTVPMAEIIVPSATATSTPNPNPSSSSEPTSMAPTKTPTAASRDATPRNAPLLSDFIKEWIKKETPVATKQFKSTWSQLESKIQKEIKEMDTELSKKSAEFTNRVIVETPELSQKLQSNLSDLQSKLEKDIEDIDWAGIANQIKATVASLEAKLSDIQQEVTNDEKVQSATKTLETKLLTVWKNDWKALSLQVPPSAASSSPEEMEDQASKLRKTVAFLKGTNADSLETFQVQAAKDLENAVTAERNRLQSLYQEELNTLQVQLDGANRAMTELKEEHAKEVARLENESRMSMLEQQSKIVLLETINNDRLATIQQLQEDNLNQKEQLQKKQSEDLARMQKDLEEALRASEAKYKVEKAQVLESTAAKVAELEALQGNAKKELSDLQQKLSSVQLKEEEAQKKSASLSTELAQVKKDEEKIVSEKAAVEAQRDRLQKELEETKALNSKTTDELRKVSEALRNVQAETADMASRQDEYEKEKVMLREELEKVQREKKDELEQLKTLSAEWDRLQEDQARLIQATAEEARQEVVQQAKEAFRKASLQYDALARDYQSAMLLISELEDQLAASKSQTSYQSIIQQEKTESAIGASDDLTSAYDATQPIYDLTAGELGRSRQSESTNGAAKKSPQEANNSNELPTEQNTSKDSQHVPSEK